MDEAIAHMRERVELPSPQDIDLWDRPKTDVPPEWYMPYKNVSSDVPALKPFGEGYRYHITGLFHDERGYPTLRLDEIDPWLDRVFGKIERGTSDILMYETDTELRKAEIVVIAYGATARSARRAVKLARNRGTRASLLTLQTIWPFPEELIESIGDKIHCIVVPEMNLGQVALEVERVVGRKKVTRVNRANGELIPPDEIVDAIERRCAERGYR
jgi:2-oxoglutarate ferredoxin oxidoreductase subunit alpha